MPIVKILLLFLLPMSFAKTQFIEPKMENNQPVLGAQVESLLRKKHPDFKVLSPLSFTDWVNNMTNNHPSSIIGDFNGDKISDAAVYGYSKREGKFFIYAVVSSKKGKSFQLHSVEERPFMKDQITTGFSTYLKLGRREKPGPGDRDTIQIETASADLKQVESFYYSKKANKIQVFEGKMD